MTGRLLVIVMVVVCLATALQAEAAPTNVALGKAVTLSGGSFFTGGWGAGLVADPASVVDGAFFARSTQWDQGPVWWDQTTGGTRYITVDLGAVYCIDSFIIQADDNDLYRLSYWDGAAADWKTAWDVPATGGWGMQTRPDPTDDTARYMLATSLCTDKLRIEGLPGDSLYSVSELQAFGVTATPELSTWALLACSGLLGVVLRRRRVA